MPENLMRREEILYNFYDEDKIRILNLLWNRGAMDLEEISRSLQIEPKVALKALSELEKECVIGKRVEHHSIARELYYAAIGRERCIELCEMVLEDSSKSLLQLEMEAEEEMRKNLKRFARKAHFD
jgi:predicted transcriptional regulator